ncbi:MAG: sugar phosphate isomerase/epimerase [Planctomycetes bacterium]|nr:sugar phosphate isomerase/epimerase [Planctomycetota bacterium]
MNLAADRARRYNPRMLPRFAYSTNAFTRTDLGAAIDAIARLGFAGIEVLADAPHLVPGQTDAAAARALGARVRAAGLAISNVNINTARVLDGATAGDGPGPTLVEADGARRAARLQYVVQALECAGELGAAAASITSGPLPAGADAGVARRLFLDALPPILERARALGLRVGIEYEPDFVVGTAETLAQVLAAAAAPELGANLDLGHAQVVGDAPEAAIRRFAGRTWNMHVEDIRGRVHHHLVPGDGDLDFAAVRRALAETGYGGFLTLELYTCADAPVEAGRRGLAALRRLLGGDPGASE